ncbi:MAG: radical SAM protein [Eubacterium sp.]|nr:radical SAM protein [Eubacterium sp.]
MANIMMTDVCNLNCPYCFANEFVNKDKNEITEEAFQKAVDFIVGDGSHSSVGLIGGEPTIHSKFECFMRKLLVDERVHKVMVYTNGILLNQFWNVICHPKTHLLINCNSPEDVGDSQFRRLCDNLRVLIEEKICINRITLGINMYRTDFEYRYILELLKKYHFHHVRISITVPNISADRNINVHSYFESMKPYMFKFFHELLQNEIIPNFDCNKIPSCLVKKGEVEQFKPYLNNVFIKNNIGRSNIVSAEVCCAPVIDIRQDLTAVRCFGLSDCTKQRIEDYESIKELEHYYIRTIDAFAYNTAYCDKCVDCHLRKVMRCSGGCLEYKISQILELNTKADELLRAFQQ